MDKKFIYLQAQLQQNTSIYKYTKTYLQLQYLFKKATLIKASVD
jgi:hypothetical protein